MNDLKFAFHQLLKNPGFTAVAVLTLALGIGANTAIFSVVHAVLLRPLPYPEPERLVCVCERNAGQGWDQYVTSMGAYADWRQQNSVFQELAAATVLGPATMIGQTEAELVNVGAISANFFRLLGIRPTLGRQFSVEEETPRGGNVVLLSEGLWRARFGADPQILNHSIRLGDRSFTVVGVMPAHVKLFDPAGVQGWENGFSKSDLWRPLPVDSGLRKQRNYRAFLVLARLKPNVSLARAQNEMSNIARQQAREYPDSNAGWSIVIQPWQKTVVHNARLPLVLLFGAVSFVLLIAAANLINLCLARAASRQKEFAIRIALGAGRFRMARQFLTEALLLSGLGGAMGLLFAHSSLSLISRFIPANVPRTDEIHLDVWVLGFALATSLLVGVFVGLVPLVSFWRSDADRFLKAETRGSTGSAGTHRLRALLVTAQVALVMVLLTGAGLLTRSFRHLSNVDPGFQAEHLLAFDVSIGGVAYTNQFARIQFIQQLLARLAELRGLEASAAVDGLPLDAGRASMDIALTSIEGTPPATPDQKLIAGLRLVSPGYFQILGISLLRGRLFTARDNTNALPVAIINEALAQRYFPGSDPVGRRIGSPDFGPQPCEIVGVVNDVKQTSLDAPAKPEVFRPLLQECFSAVTVVARSRSATAQIFVAMRKEAASVDQSLPAYNSRMLDLLVSASLAPRRFAMWLMGLFAGLALLLSLVGIYGVLSCVISERTHEIGIRMAIGAQRRDVLAMVLLRGMRPVVIGGLVGLAGACALTRFLRSLLYEVSPNDPFTLTIVAFCVSVVALLACWLPACRAAQVDPMEALRYE